MILKAQKPCILLRIITGQEWKLVQIVHIAQNDSVSSYRATKEPAAPFRVRGSFVALCRRPRPYECPTGCPSSVGSAHCRTAPVSFTDRKRWPEKALPWSFPHYLAIFRVLTLLQAEQILPFTVRMRT